MRPFLFLGFLGLYFWQSSAIPCGQFPDQASCAAATKCSWEASTKTCRCKDSVADFVFLIDGSGSIGRSKFGVQMSMVHDLLSQSVPANSGVGFILFASAVTAVQPLFPRKNISEYIQIAQGIQWPNGATLMGDAVQMSLGFNFFGDPRETRTNLRIFLVTDGQPSPGTTDPCQFKDAIARWPGLHVIILGVGSGFQRAAVQCLVQKEPNPDAWIIQIQSYTKAAFAQVLPQLDTQFCPDTIDLKVTEVKPVRHLNSSQGVQQYTGTIWFEFINSGTSPVPLNKVSMRGLFNGFLVGSSDARFVQPGQAVVVYHDNGFVPNCLNCNCTRSSVRSEWCQSALYIRCGAGGFCRVQDNWQFGLTKTNWFIELYDNTGAAVKIEDVKFDAAQNWPNLTAGFTYELKKWGIADNKNGRNWQESCTEQGTPGTEPLKVCTQICSVQKCRNNGDGNATCVTGTNTCKCSGQYFYPESGTCLSLLPPRECNATLVKRAQGVYEVHYTWTSVPVPPGINYSLVYASGKSVNTFSNFQSLPYPSPVWGPGPYDGEVQSLFKTFDYQNAETVYKSFPPTPCLKKTSAPTPAPTQSPVTFQTLKVYVGGDICAQERCACAFRSFACSAAPPNKPLTVGANEFVTISRTPLDFQQDIVVEFVVESLGGQQGARRRLLSNNNNGQSTTMAPLTNGTCNATADVCPQKGFARLPVGAANVRIPLEVRGAQSPLYRFVIIGCTVGNQPCRLFYPNNITLSVSIPAASSVGVTTNQLPEWLWWLIGALILFLFLLALLAYQFWWKNRETNKHLDATRADLDHAIAENELGFAHDLDAGDVVFNPIATGVPGSSNAPDFFSNEVAQRRGDALNTRADVAVEKFQHREQFGQVAGPNKGNDLSQPLLS